MLKKIQRLIAASKLSKAYLLSLLIVFLLIRLYHIDGPIVDRHSWNQISAASMAKYISQDWKFIIYPTVDVFTSPSNPNRTYAQEFPLYHIPIAIIYKLTGVSEWPGRLISIIFGMIGLWYCYLISLHIFSEKIALLTLFFAGFSSLNWFYNRAVMCDTSMVTAMTAGSYHFYLWLEENARRQYWYSLSWTAAAGLFKPFGLIIGVIFLSLIILRKEFYRLFEFRTYFFALTACLPTIVWVIHAMNLPDGISEFTDWNSMNQILHPELLLSLDFYNRIILVRLVDGLLSPWAGVFCVIGIASIRLKDIRYHLPTSWLIACFVYTIIVQNGNYVHEYYQLPFIPGLAIFAAIGVVRFWHWQYWNEEKKTYIILLLLSLSLLHNTIYAKRYFQYDIGSYNTGKKISELSQHKNDKVLAFDVGSNKWNQLIYYSGLTGWFQDTELTIETVELYRRHGARWLGVNLLFDSHFKKYSPVLENLRMQYPMVWEDMKSKDRYGRKVLSRVYDLH